MIHWLIRIRFFLIFSCFVPLVLFSSPDDALDRYSKVMKRGSVTDISQLAQDLVALNSAKGLKKLRSMLNEAKAEEVQIIAIEHLAKGNKKEAFDILRKATRRVKSTSAKESLFEALCQTADSEYLSEKGIKHSSGIIRGVAFFDLSKNFVKPSEKIQEIILKEKDVDALIGLASYLGMCLKKNVETSFAKEKLATLIENKDLAVQGIALKSLSRVSGESIFRMIEKSYNHPDWRVRLKILENIAEQGDDKRILRFLITALRKEDGRLRQDIANILEELTGQDHGINATAWMNAVVNSGGIDFGGEEVQTSHSSYYGIDVVSKRIVFIFDKTGSMINPSPNKLQIAKDKLCEVLESLDADLKGKSKSKYEKIDPYKRTHFSIISFSNSTHWWKKNMVPATEKNIKKACEWVQSISATGPTHADLPLREALKFAGGSSKDKKVYWDATKEVDTIFFVTDGSPYKMEFGNGKEAGALMDEYSDEIISMVAKLNEKLKIAIHAIGILPPGSQSRFLEELARVSEGEVVYVSGG